MTLAEQELRHALKLSKRMPDIAGNQHWLARLVIGFWSGHIPLFAILAPQSLVGRSMEQVGYYGWAAMAALGVISAVAIVDSAVSDRMPNRFKALLRRNRHIGFCLLAVTLTITGGGIAHTTKTPVAITSFLLPAVFCVFVTAADLFLRARETHR